MSSLFEKCPECNKKTSGRLICTTDCRSSFWPNSQHSSNPDREARLRATNVPPSNVIPRLSPCSQDTTYPEPTTASMFWETPEPESNGGKSLANLYELKKYEGCFDEDRDITRLREADFNEYIRHLGPSTPEKTRETYLHRTPSSSVCKLGFIPSHSTGDFNNPFSNKRRRREV